MKKRKSIPWLFYALEDENEEDVKQEILHALVSLGINRSKIQEIMTQNAGEYLNKVIVNAY